MSDSISYSLANYSVEKFDDRVKQFDQLLSRKDTKFEVIDQLNKQIKDKSKHQEIARIVYQFLSNETGLNKKVVLTNNESRYWFTDYYDFVGGKYQKIAGQTGKILLIEHSGKAINDFVKQIELLLQQYQKTLFTPVEEEKEEHKSTSEVNININK